MELLEIFEESDPCVVILLTNDFSERQQRLKANVRTSLSSTEKETNLFVVMGCQYGEGGHSIDRYRFRNSCSKRLSKERDPTFCLTATREEVALEACITLANEKRGSTQGSSTADATVHLVIEQL